MTISAVSGQGVAELTGAIVDGLPVIETETAPSDGEPAVGETARGWAP